MYLSLNGKIISGEPSQRDIRESFDLLKSFRDILIMHKDGKNYIEATRMISGGYELKYCINYELFRSDLNCIKKKHAADIFAGYSSGDLELIEKLRWTLYTIPKLFGNIKSIALLLFVPFLFYARINGQFTGEKFLLSWESLGVSYLLVSAFILIVIILAEWKYLESFKIIEGPKKFYSVVPLLLLFMVAAAWLKSVFW